VLDRLLPSRFLVGCALIVCWTLGIRWWINSISCFPMSLVVLVFRVPEIPFQNEGVLAVDAQDLEPFWRLFCRLALYELDWTSLYAPNFWGTKHIYIYLKRLGWFWNSIATFQRVICPWLFLLMVLSDWGISDIVPDDARFLGAGLSFFRYFWLNMGLA